MSTITHKDLPDSELHDVKGAVSAPLGTVLGSVEDGKSSFNTLYTYMQYLEPILIEPKEMSPMVEVGILENATEADVFNVIRKTGYAGVDNNFASLVTRLNEAITELNKKSNDLQTAQLELNEIKNSLKHFNLIKDEEEVIDNG